MAGPPLAVQAGGGSAESASLDGEVPAALVRSRWPGTGVGFWQPPLLCLSVSSFFGLLIWRVTVTDVECQLAFRSRDRPPGHGVSLPLSEHRVRPPDVLFVIFASIFMSNIGL